jgi:amino acid adenylation domain-containing protein
LNACEKRNNTERKYQLKCIHTLFEEQVIAYPDNIAVSFEGRTLSYEELNKRANNLAHIIIGLGTKANDFVGIYAERSLELIVGIIGILKSGAAYVPLSTEYPSERIEYILDDSKCRIVLTQKKYENVFGRRSNINVVFLDDLNAPEDCSNPEVFSNVDNIAYLIYTSGSTGKPKGVMIKHSGICNRLLWMKDEYQFTVNDALLHKAPIGFDVSVWEIFYPLICGAKLVLARPGWHRNIKYLVNLINSTGVTLIHFIPPALDVFLDYLKPGDCLSLRIIICGGEKWSFSLGEKCIKRLNVKLYNGYGPTEASVGVAFWLFDPEYKYKTVPIGKPISNTRLYIVDENLAEVSAGETGELCISGICLSPGYLNNTELTNSKFIINTFSNGDIKYKYLYRTGDMAKYLEDGNIEFIGRIDNQVKIRGMRLELGEIENALLKNENIAEAIVLCKQVIEWDKILIAYVILKEKGIVDATYIRSYLSSLLPDYMIPHKIVIMDSFPVNDNGKIDKNKLMAL